MDEVRDGEGCDASIVSADLESPEPSAPPPIDRRQQCIQDYLLNAFEKPNPLAANVGILNGDLMNLAYRVRQAMDDGFDEGLDALERFELLTPVIDTTLKLTKQIDRLSQLEMRLKSATIPPGLTSSSLAQTGARSEDSAV